jgi:hypothetical protein
MRTTIALLLLILAGLAGFSTYQHNELQRTQSEATKLATERATLIARLRELERRFTALQMAPPTDSVGSQALPTTPSSPGFSGMPEADAAAAAAEAAAQERAFVAAILTDPKRREAMLTQNRMIARMQHGGIIQRLDLNPQQVDALIEILAQRQLANLGRGGIAAGETPDTTRQRIAELDRTEGEEIAKLLGADKAQRFSNLRETLTARASLQPVVQELELARIPLKPEQQDQLAQIVHEQTEAMRATMPTPAIAGTTPPTPEQSQAQAKTFREWQLELNRRIVDGANGLLTPQQAQRLSAYLQQQVDISNMSFASPNG